MNLKVFLLGFFFFITSTCLLSQSAEGYYQKGYDLLCNARIGNNHDLTKVIQEYNKAIKKDSKFAKAYIERGKLKSMLLDHRGALKDFNKYVKLRPNDVEGYATRATANQSLNKHKLAVSDFTKAINLSDEDSPLAGFTVGTYYYFRGYSNYNLGKYENACNDWSKAGELGNSAGYTAIQEYCN